MKKVLSIILALVMCLSLCACGSNDDTGKAEDKSKKYRVNETATSSLFECSLTQVSFANRVEAMEHHSDYLLPATENTNISIPAKTGNILLCFTVNLKYVGTKSIQNMGFGNGKNVIGFYATYDTSYEYTTFVASRRENYSWLHYQTFDGDVLYCYSFAPLSNEIYSIRAYIEMPAVVAQNTDKPLDITVCLGNNESVTFTVNP